MHPVLLNFKNPFAWLTKGTTWLHNSLQPALWLVLIPVFSTGIFQTYWYTSTTATCASSRFLHADIFDRVGYILSTEVYSPRSTIMQFRFALMDPTGNNTVTHRLIESVPMLLYWPSHLHFSCLPQGKCKKLVFSLSLLSFLTACLVSHLEASPFRENYAVFKKQSSSVAWANSLAFLNYQPLTFKRSSEHCQAFNPTFHAYEHGYQTFFGHSVSFNTFQLFFSHSGENQRTYSLHGLLYQK